MSRLRRPASLLTLTLTCALVGAALAPALATNARPRWVRHALHYSGGISNGVRERLAVAMGKTTTTAIAKKRLSLAAAPAIDNQQLNGDTDPPLPHDDPGIELNGRRVLDRLHERRRCHVDLAVEGPEVLLRWE